MMKPPKDPQKFFRNTLILSCFLAAGFDVSGQPAGVLVRARVYDADSKEWLKEGSLEVTQNNRFITTANCDARGRFPAVEFRFSSRYTLKISSPGYLSKLIGVDCFWRGGWVFPNINVIFIECSLFKTDDTLKFESIKNTPVAIFKMDSSGYFNYDKSYTERVLYQLDSCRFVSMPRGNECHPETALTTEMLCHDAYAPSIISKEITENNRNKAPHKLSRIHKRYRGKILIFDA